MVFLLIFWLILWACFNLNGLSSLIPFQRNILRPISEICTSIIYCSVIYLFVEGCLNIGGYYYDIKQRQNKFSKLRISGDIDTGILFEKYVKKREVVNIGNKVIIYDINEKGELVKNEIIKNPAKEDESVNAVDNVEVRSHEDDFSPDPKWIDSMGSKGKLGPGLLGKKGQDKDRWDRRDTAQGLLGSQRESIYNE